jgi:type III pantothenate kinase
MIIAADLGNTALKLGVFDDNRLIVSQKFGYSDKNDIENFFQTHSCNHLVFSSVTHIPDYLSTIFDKIPFKLEVNSSTPLPIANSYGTPQTLGTDRISNAVGAAALYPGRPVLAIDCGTCLKFDFVHPENGYEGGAISPGLNMRFKALHDYTARLPLIAYRDESPLIGKNTEESILSGVIHGMLAEIKGISAQYSNQFPDLICVITGGDYLHFYNSLKTFIFAAPDLTLTGLREILRYNQ